MARAETEMLVSVPRPVMSLLRLLSDLRLNVLFTMLSCPRIKVSECNQVGTVACPRTILGIVAASNDGG